MTGSNADLAALDAAHTLRPCNQMQAGPERRVIVKGDGLLLWDDQGNRYLDALGGLWCTQIGLGGSEMAQAIGDQAQRLMFSSTFVDMSNGPAALLVANLAELAPLTDLPLVGDVRGKVLIGCVEFVGDKANKALLPDEIDIGHRIADAAEAEGQMVRPIGHLNVMSLALTIDTHQISFIAKTLEGVIKTVANDLTRQNITLD